MTRATQKPVEAIAGKLKGVGATLVHIPLEQATALLGATNLLLFFYSFFSFLFFLFYPFFFLFFSF